ncbi:alpha-L RNA-binding motif-containing protein [Eremomyces bilateralis CBS 781.70]|uniref:Alpha-L RNA-binding motif-containing protein n=1 Tax=Eremomyces bilateralis CBS 781.70 TaxID=1392243 RepID=A0A6G1G1G2_9PEZI|nr:alpha-L RNA-binding motif-containing protein [Eremomyces bilateralis CBS 781.70]KAF1811858.1 alpha-L RNA-binding motif-containing protein [Eremomyces bilateralis CBS 781.70]
MARQKLWISLRKPKIRQSWNKYNLYNLSRLAIPSPPSATYFQQKWSAKAISRPYHGGQVREKQWARMFSRRMPSVQPMDYRYLAESDGSQESAGRGSGEELAQKPRSPREATPYMQMVYHQLERRLDTAVFRAMFASSIRQSRQFVARGLVKVNGQKMPYPGYMLNPGDMFSLPPDLVMFATGQQKPPTKSLQQRTRARAKPRINVDAADAEMRAVVDQMAALGKDMDTFRSSHPDLPPPWKAELFALGCLARRATNNPGVTPQVRVDILGQLNANFDSLKAVKDFSSASPAQTQAPLKKGWERRKRLIVRRWMEGTAEPQPASTNPITFSKPYRTPWMPRDYMSAFAFIPRYLEVNQNVCSAVYLRDPVARPGLGEVPTPFPTKVSQLAFNWYLRRR